MPSKDMMTRSSKGKKKIHTARRQEIKIKFKFSRRKNKKKLLCNFNLLLYTDSNYDNVI
jgi:predicted transcriptional regulator